MKAPALNLHGISLGRTYDDRPVSSWGCSPRFSQPSAVTSAQACTTFALSGDARPMREPAIARSPRKAGRTKPAPSVAKTRLQQRGMLRAAACALATERGLRLSPEPPTHRTRAFASIVESCRPPAVTSPRAPRARPPSATTPRQGFTTTQLYHGQNLLRAAAAADPPPRRRPATAPVTAPAPAAATRGNFDVPAGAFPAVRATPRERAFVAAAALRGAQA